MSQFDIFNDDERPQVTAEIIPTGAGRTVVVRPVGEIDMLSETELLQGLSNALEWEHATGIIVDLSGVTFFSSSGIGALASAHASARERGMSLRAVVPVGSSTLRALTLTGVTDVITTPSSLAEAVAAASSQLAHGAGTNDPVTAEDDDLAETS